jgi:hypothetical protein
MDLEVDIVLVPVVFCVSECECECEDTVSFSNTRRTGTEAPIMAVAVSTAVQMVTSLPLSKKRS